MLCVYVHMCVNVCMCVCERESVYAGVVFIEGNGSFTQCILVHMHQWPAQTYKTAVKWNRMHVGTYFWIMDFLPLRDISSLLLALKDAIRLHFIPSITGRNSISDTERDLFALPARLGGLALPNPTASAFFEYSSSIKITAPLVSCIFNCYSAWTFLTPLLLIKNRPRLQSIH